MNKRFILGLIMMIALLVVNQVFIQYNLQKKKDDALVINLAGKQRMLSQRISLEIYKSIKQGKRTLLLNELFTEWESTHFALCGSIQNDNIPVIENPLIVSNLKKLDAKIDFTKTFIQSDFLNSPTDMEEIDFTLQDFLTKMNAEVNQLQIQSDERLFRIIFIEIGLLIISLIVLLLEFKYVYLPLFNDLKKKGEQNEEQNVRLATMNLALTNQNKYLEEYSFLTGHNLQEPLKNLEYFSEELNENYSHTLDAEGQVMLRKVRELTLKLKALIRGIQFLSEVGKSDQFVTEDLDQTVTAICSELKKKYQHLVINCLYPTLPELKTRPGEAQKVFYQLLDNAIKFQPKDSTRIELGISVRENPNNFEFTIEDSGIGFNESYNEKVFHIFQQLDSSKEHKGIGIGLSIAKKIVEAHGGKIWFESKEGEGTKVHFTWSKTL